ncbi:mitochondrial carrier domain-containing protein [Polychytrium aggregatum]|uniref:mitochondrial carrier domain-containing protein n=1 Tax=Polychytrium aggregatum TaxID=110093 RepID=UPI0022FF0343|nr:mitochondrial carrier domain-containing protein [Polychytrium aggregatum]KAI9206363.1 mitochondrial carrier domain-containing protein [Polychytrium aggregatum]
MAHDDNQKSHNGLKSFISGAAGGVTMVAASHPFDLVKVRMQLKSDAASSSALSVARSIVKSDGLIGLYRGAVPVLYGTPPVLALCFWGYYVGQVAMLQLLGPQRHASTSSTNTNAELLDSLSLTQIGIAGSIAAVPTSLLLGPAERIKILLQMQESRLSRTENIAAETQTRSMNNLIRQLYQNGGIRTFFRGTGMTLLRDVPGNFVYFAAYEGIKRMFESYTHTDSTKGKVNPGIVLLAGGLAGMACWTAIFPVDVLKSQIQLHGTLTKGPLNLRQAVQTYGISFKGLGPTLLRAFPASASMFLGVELCNALLDKLF